MNPNLFRRTRIGTTCLVAAALLGPAAIGCTPSSTPADLAATIEERIDTGLEMLDPHDRIRAVIVWQRGDPLVERYVDSTPDDYWDTRSVTKSVASTLVGIAIDRGLIPGVESTLGELLPSYSADLTPETSSISLRDVLTHTANFLTEADDDEAVWGSTDLVRAILNDRAARGPSEGQFRYSDAGAHILAAILVEATEMSVLDFARRYLLDPLGVVSRPGWEVAAATTSEDWEATLDSFDAADFAWPADAQGIHFGHANLRLRPSDLARFGQLYLSRGVVDSEQIVSEAWVAEATAPRVYAGAMTSEYGYQWWVEREEGYFCALGRGGTAVLVHPQKDAVIVVASQIDARDVAAGTLSTENALYLATSILAELE